MTTTSQNYEVDQYSLAQSFFVGRENGIFATKIELFFQQQAGVTNKLPVQLELRPMVNGFPSSVTSIPGSEVTVTASNINVSTDASAHTNFEFDEPIFLEGLRDYCFVVQTSTSKYKLFAAQGDTFVLGSTEERISKQQTNGSLFFSQNGATFTAAQDTDISFKLKQARFKHTTGTITLKNTAVPQRLLGSDPITTDSGSPIITINHPNHGFQPNDFVNISINGASSVGGLDSTNITGLQRILDSSVDYTGFKINVGTAATSSGSGGGSNVLCDKNIPFSVLYPKVETLIPNSTGLSAGFRGTVTKSFSDTNYGNTSSTSKYSKDADYGFLALNTGNESETPFVVLSTSNNDSASISNGSANVQLSLGTGDSDVSPVIDLQRASLTGICYQIDKQAAATATGFNKPISFVAETNPSSGSAAAKHITKTITLAEDAVGLKVFLAANRPSDTDFEVYFRTATNDQVITDQPFILQAEETNNPFDVDPEIFRDYEYLIGGLGGDLIPFTKFQLKIVMRSSKISKAPTFQSLRIIATST